MKTVNTFEAVYQDEEPGERSGGWEVIQWEWVKLDGSAKQGRKHSAYYLDEEDCKKAAAELNKQVDTLPV